MRKVPEKIDKTIETLCDKIQKKAHEETFDYGEIPQLVSALAELISARGRLIKESLG